MESWTRQFPMSACRRAICHIRDFSLASPRSWTSWLADHPMTPVGASEFPDPMWREL